MLTECNFNIVVGISIGIILTIGFRAILKDLYELLLMKIQQDLENAD